MKRLLLFVAVVAALIAAAVWLADRPGEVTVHWQGWRLDTTVPVLGLAVLALVALLEAALRLLRLVVGGPRRLLAARRARRVQAGYRALSDGLAAVASGDRGQARKQAKKADRLLADRSLTGLLSAQAAELAGDQSEARQRLTDMVARPETAFLGLKGLLGLALKDGDDAQALDCARRAMALQPAASGLADTLFALQVRAGQWAEAEHTLDEARRRKAMAGPALARHRALVFEARAAVAEAAGTPADAAALALRAVDADPGFVPAAARAARLLATAGKTRKAIQVLEAAFRIGPHAELVAAWAALGAALAPLERVKHMERLVRANPAAPAGHVGLAEAALDARLWGLARTHLEMAAAARPSAAVYRLMARLEQAERKDDAAAAAWTAKAEGAAADPAWTCAACGTAASAWSAVCSSCNAVGALA